MIGTLGEIFEKNLEKIQKIELGDNLEGEKEKKHTAFVSGFVSIERNKLSEFIDLKTFENDILKIVNSLKNSRPQI